MADTLATISPENPDILADALGKFTDDVENFLEAMADVWPDCGAVRKLQGEFLATARSSVAPVRDMAQKAIITQFHTTMAPLYDRCRASDHTIFGEANVSILQDIDMVGKWNDNIDDATRDAIFAWLVRICTHAELYNFYSQVPHGMLSRLTGAAMNMATTMGDGPLDMQKLQATVGSLMGSLDPNEMQNFAQTIASQPSSLAILGRMGADQGVDMQGVMGMLLPLMGAQRG